MCVRAQPLHALGWGGVQVRRFRSQPVYRLVLVLLGGAAAFSLVVGTMGAAGATVAPAAQVVVQALPSTLSPGGLSTLTVTVSDASGTSVADDPVSFSTEGTACGAISSLVTTDANGQATTSYKASTSGTTGGCVVKATEASSHISGTATLETMTSPAITVTPSRVSFPGVTLGQSSPPTTLTLTNTGTAPLSVSAVNTTPPFSVTTDTCTESTVAPGSSCDVAVDYSPTTPGPVTGNASVVDNAPASPQVLALAGTGVPPEAPSGTTTSSAPDPPAIATAGLPAPVGSSQSASSSPRYYMALGDSLATGFTAPAGQGYVDDLFAYYQKAIPTLQLVNYGCPGETTSSFISGPSCGDPGGSQLAAAESFLKSHPGQVAFVTIDIGGDDINSCAPTAPPFTVNGDCVVSALSSIQSHLTDIMAGLRAADASVPIYAMNYFDPYVIAWLEGSQGQAFASESVLLLNQLNTVLSSSYLSGGARIVDVASAFEVSNFSQLVTTEQWGTIPVSVANACNWLTVVCRVGGPEGFGIHPNATGYQVIADAFEQVIGLISAPPAPAGPPPTAAVTNTRPPTTPTLAPPAQSLGAAPVRPGPVSLKPTRTLAFTGFPLQQFLFGGLGAIALGILLRLIILIGAKRSSRP